MQTINKLWEKVSGQKTYRLSPDELAEKVNELFIINADEFYLEKLSKIAKGNLKYKSEISSEDDRYIFDVYEAEDLIIPFLNLFIVFREVSIFDIEEDCYYTLDKKRNYKTFYRLIKSKIDFRKAQL